ncbi:MAG: TIGR02281 family clan AA aspartic protease [Methylophilaceae bacterium]|nr:TIGR02281 family clan AA aspartic protease [Methyloradius sp.]
MKLFIYLLLLITTNVFADSDINVVGLFSSKAVVIINHGRPQTLSVGQRSPEGVKLVSADSSKAVFEVDGKQKQLGMGQAATVFAGSGSPGTVTITSNEAGGYYTDGAINGVIVKFLVDTGANVVALNTRTATNAGIDYSKGGFVGVHTANGTTTGYHVVIDSLKVGSIVLTHVDAVVGVNGPDFVLLGMTALRRLQMSQDGNTITLVQRY